MPVVVNAVSPQVGFTEFSGNSHEKKSPSFYLLRRFQNRWWRDTIERLDFWKYAACYFRKTTSEIAIHELSFCQRHCAICTQAQSVNYRLQLVAQSLLLPAGKVCSGKPQRRLYARCWSQGCALSGNLQERWSGHQPSVDRSPSLEARC